MLHSFLIALDGAQTIPSATTPAVGTGTATYDSVAGTLSYSLTTMGLDFGPVLNNDQAQTVATTDDVTAAHIHMGARGGTGGVAFNLLSQDSNDFTHQFNADGSATLSGTWDSTDNASTEISSISDLFTASIAGSDIALYFNIHTTTNPAGEIRGQLIAAETVMGAVREGTVVGDLMEGTEQDDELDGLQGPDTIRGFGGNDTLIGGTGNDVIAGGDGDDSIDGGLGSDSIFGGEGNDYLTADGQGSVAIYGDAGNDTIIGLGQLDGSVHLNVKLVGGAGDDSITAADNAFAKIFAGTGNDTVEASTAAFINTGDGDDVVRQYQASGQNIPTQTIYTGAGNDLIEVSGDYSRIADGAGNDTMRASSGTDDTIHYTRFTRHQITVTEIDGGGLQIVTPDGTDEAYGFELFDLADGGFSGQSLLENSAIDATRLIGTSASETLDGGDGADLIEGNEGNDLLRGLAGNDFLYGGPGRDTLNGGEGDDVIEGGYDPSSSANFYGARDLADIVYAGAGHDTVNGGYGNDQLNGESGDDIMNGGHGSDTIIGHDGDDQLSGAAVADVIFGGAGIDFINGGFGSDRLNGGADADRFYHQGIAGHGNDWIQDFSTAEGDALEFGGNATIEQFQVNTASTAMAGSDQVGESFIIYKPTGQILWALVDGEEQSSFNIIINDETFELMN